MKRYNCTLSDKRGAFGDCMEAHSTGRYVLFSDVEKLQRRMQDLLDKSNRTGVAIERAISTGSVLTDHPLKSRLELLANHHKREQALADGMVDMADRCNLLIDLLREARTNVDQVRRWGRFEHDEGCGAEAALLLERIDALLAGNQPDQSGITLSAADLVELADFCSPDRDTDPEQLGTEIVLFYRRAFKSTDGDDMPAGVYVHLADYPEEGLFGPVGGRRLVGKRPDRPDNEWTDGATSPTAEDYRELQAQHDQVQSRFKVALDIVRDLVELPYSTGGVIVRLEVRERARDLLAGQVPALAKGRTLTEGQEFELTTVLQSIANGFSDDPAHDAASMLKRIAGEVPWTGDSFQLPPRQGGEPCASEPPSSSPA